MSSSFLVTLWPWVKVKVINTGIKIQNLVMSVIKQSLKEMGSKASKHPPILNIPLFKINEFEVKFKFSPLSIINHTNKIQHELKQINRSWQLTKFQPNQLRKLQGNERRSTCFHTTVTLHDSDGHSILFYSRLSPSIAGSSPPPQSSNFLCPLLSLSILLPLPQNDTLWDNLPSGFALRRPVASQPTSRAPKMV